MIRKKLLSFLIAGLPILVALFVFAGFTRSFDFAKIIIFRISLLSILALMCLDFFKHSSLQVPVGYFKAKPSRYLGLGIGFLFISTLASPQALHSIWGEFERGMGLIQWIALAIYFYLGLLYLDKKWIERGLTILIFGSACIAAYGVAQKWGWDPLFAGYNTKFLQGRIFSTLGNPDFLAQWLAPMLVLALWKWQQASKKLLAFIPVGLMFLALVFTESRASFLALILGLGFFAFQKTKRKSRILLGALIVFMAFVLAVQLDLPLFSRFSWNIENIRSVASRIFLWKAALMAILDHPFLGLGPDNFGLHFGEYVDPRFFYLEETLHITADRPHNELLEVALAGGLPLLTLYLALQFWIVGFLMRNKGQTSLQEVLATALLVITLQNQLSFSTFPHFLLSAFLLLSLIVISTKREEVEIHWSKAFQWIGIPLITIFLCFCLIEAVAKPVLADLWYSYALSTTDREEFLIRAINNAPLESKYRYELLIGYPETRPQQVEALELIEGPTIDVLGWKASTLSVVDPVAAKEVFEYLLDIAPQNVHVNRAYADMFYRQKDYAAAIPLYENYLNLVPPFWKWCPEWDAHTTYEQNKFRTFYKKVPDFNNTILHLQEAYRQVGQAEKAQALQPFIECTVPVKS